MTAVGGFGRPVDRAERADRPLPFRSRGAQSLGNRLRHLRCGQQGQVGHPLLDAHPALLAVDLVAPVVLQRTPPGRGDDQCSEVGLEVGTDAGEPGADLGEQGPKLPRHARGLQCGLHGRLQTALPVPQIGSENRVPLDGQSGNVSQPGG
ncbi:hypothetical protein JCM9534A_18500 [Catenuloplanes indicus JCM 9534]